MPCEFEPLKFTNEGPSSTTFKYLTIVDKNASTIKKEDKAMAIITISRQMGSLGDEIAKSVADKLNYEYIDKPEITEALADYGLRVHEKFDEKGLSFWESFSCTRSP